ncbi:FG-GAP-like repeat-containing protein [Sulfitobacter aestuariivivens]|uniref:VCBS repeat-containing protein n=1 Tax=Sulfitobacter aestuariivivens TaxID=2766981 RepID=A0A927HFY4_9RHOB|nr:FG-GAP-like repeat-containing protein [Sulfitobacter aestuariivivens]MBD3664928.1 VCBS repeat-containing protein [Sulfitobacter aestuariivivens]
MQIIHHQQKVRFFIAGLILIVLAYLFWTGSRYPALDEKAMMSGAIQLEDSLSFEAAFPLTDDMTLLQRIFWSTLNWIDTNKKGMTFGVLFAASFLTVAPYLRRRSFRGGFANSFLGMVIGAPLGVCVNCAAPIAKGMYSAGLRAETTLSAMIASPTLNVVVLTMLFSILPFWMAVTKIVLSLAVILVAVPLICRMLPQVELPEEEIICNISPPGQETVQGARMGENPAFAVIAVAREYLRNLWYIVRLTVPLMLLAGLLGATAATLLPQELITGLGYSLFALVIIAVVGLFLPVPIAFDVVVTGALLSAGLAHGYVMALLFTLGTFSVYSFFIVAQAIGQRAAWLLAAAVAALGILAGAGAQAYYEWQSARALEMLLQGDATPRAPPLFMAAHADTVSGLAVTSADADRIKVEARPLAPLSPVSETAFTRLEANEIGIDKPLEFSFRDMWPPFWEGRAVTSGDIDRDGDLDIAIASTEVGLYLYANDGAGKFTPIEVDLGPLKDAHVFQAVLIDVDNDGWLDLFLGTYLQGNFVWPNVEGTFGAAALMEVKGRGDEVMALALSFADADRDGDLDLALGNWAAGWYRRIPGEESRNRIIWNDDGALSGEQAMDLPGLPGETLSILFTDLDLDGAADLIVGNDFDIPDYFYRGDGAGGFKMIDHASGLIPHTTTTTMAVKSADLSNSGAPDIYLAQIAGRSSGVSETLKMQSLDVYCDGINDVDARAVCLKNMKIKSWYKSGNNFDPTYAKNCQSLEGRYKDECRAMLVKDLAIQKKDPKVCGLIPAGQLIPRAYCDAHFLPVRQPTAEEIELTHPQILRSNVLLDWSNAAYVDRAEDVGLDVGGWSWDTKIADFDHDGWQDVYIVNGTWVPNEVSPSNLFFHNQGDGTFKEASGPFGLEDYLMTAAATTFDMDGDGDLDMLTHPVNGPLVVFRNNTQVPGIVFQLIDEVGNRDGVGAVLTLTDEGGMTQMREVQVGGGFMSFDAPLVHFGLGDKGRATQLDVRWATGDATVITGPLEAGLIYTVQRLPE